MVTRERSARDVTAALVRRYGHLDTSAAALNFPNPPSTATVRPFGPLQEIRMRRLSDGGEEVWRFGPTPRLVFNGTTKRLWTLGRGFHFDGQGFHPRGGDPRGLVRGSVEAARRDPTLRGQLNEYVRTRYGLAPNEYVVGDLALPRDAVALGYAEAIVYRTDRNDGGSTGCNPWEHADGVRSCSARAHARDRDGMSPWEHPFKDEGADVRRTRNHTKPLLCTDADGRGLWFHGGSYTVIDGWLVG